MENKTKKNLIYKVPGIIMLVLSIFLAAGVQLLFHGCIHEDGSAGTCHWAQIMIFSCALLMAAQSAVLLFYGKGKAAVSACIFLTGIMTMLIPDTLIRLCMMPSMHCQAYMKPWTLIICVVIEIICIISFITGRRSEKN